MKTQKAKPSDDANIKMEEFEKEPDLQEDEDVVQIENLNEESKLNELDDLEEAKIQIDTRSSFSLEEKS